MKTQASYEGKNKRQVSDEGTYRDAHGSAKQNDALAPRVENLQGFAELIVSRQHGKAKEPMLQEALFCHASFGKFSRQLGVGA